MKKAPLPGLHPGPSARLRPYPTFVLSRSRAKPKTLSRSARGRAPPRPALFLPRPPPSPRHPRPPFLPNPPHLPSNSRFPVPPGGDADPPQRHGGRVPRRRQHAAQRQAPADVARRVAAYLPSPIPARRRRNGKIRCSTRSPRCRLLGRCSLPSSIRSPRCNARQLLDLAGLHAEAAVGVAQVLKEAALRRPCRGREAQVESPRQASPFPFQPAHAFAWLLCAGA